MDGILLSDGSTAVLLFAVARMRSKVIYDGAFGSKSPFGKCRQKCTRLCCVHIGCLLTKKEEHA